MFVRATVWLGVAGSLGCVVVALIALDARWLAAAAGIAIGALWTVVIAEAVRYGRRGHAQGGHLPPPPRRRNLSDQFAALDAQLHQSGHVEHLLAAYHARQRDRVYPDVPERLAWIALKHQLENDNGGTR